MIFTAGIYLNTALDFNTGTASLRTSVFALSLSSLDSDDNSDIFLPMFLLTSIYSSDIIKSILS
jgi:hypothetical protein